MPEPFVITAQVKYESDIGEINQTTKAIEGNTQAINELDNAQESLNKQFEDGSISLKKYNNETKKISTERNKVLKATEDQAKSVKNVSDNTKEATKQTKSLTIAQRLAAGATTFFSGALKLLRTALITTGIGAFVVLVGSLVAIFVNLKEKVDEVIGSSRRAQTVISNLRKAFEPLADIIGTVVKSIANFIVNGLERLTPVITKVVNTVAPILKTWFTTLRNGFVNSAAFVIAFKRTFTDNIKQIGVSAEGLINILSGIGNAILGNFGKAVSDISRGTQQIKDSFSNIGNNFGDEFTKVRTNILSLFDGVVGEDSDKIKEAGRSTGKSFSNGVQEALDKAFSKQFIRDLLRKLSDEEDAEEAGRNLAKAVSKGFQSSPIEAPSPDEFDVLFGQKVFDRVQKERERASKRAKELAREELLNLASAAQDAIDIEIRKLDQLERIQEERINEARRNAEEGADASVKAEEDRLRKIQEERQKFIRAQQVLDAITIASNQAVAVSAAIKGVSENSGNPLAVAASIAALVAGVGTAALAIRNAFASIEGFEEGGYTGNMGKSDVAGVVHGGEFVMNKGLTDKHRGLFQAIHDGGYNYTMTPYGAIAYPKGLDFNSLANDHNTIKMFYNGADFNAMESELQGIKKLLKQREVRILNNFDAKGFGVSVATALGKMEINNSRR